MSETGGPELFSVRGKGVRSNLPGRPFGCFAQIGPDPFSDGRDTGCGGFEEALALVQSAQQRMDAVCYAGIVAADLTEIFGAGVGRADLAGDVEDRLFVGLVARHRAKLLLCVVKPLY